MLNGGKGKGKGDRAVGLGREGGDHRIRMAGGGGVFVMEDGEDWALRFFPDDNPPPSNNLIRKIFLE